MMKVMEPPKTQVAMSMPALILRIEGAAVLLSMLVLYAYRGENWLAFVALILVPDLSAVGYLRDVRLGSITYNVVHTYTLPLALGVLALVGGWTLGVQLALIWGAHLGMDRMLGFGLKYATDFKDTHLGRI
jgi:hypothetical protein